MNILFIGDIFGKPGREAVRRELKPLKQRLGVDLTVANAENTTHGKSVSPNHLQELMDAGVDFFTMGNHTWARKDIHATLNANANMVRPLNVAGELNNSGRGTAVVRVKGTNVRITNLIGRTCYRFEKTPNPFQALDGVVLACKEPIHIVDFHTESTGEKAALALDFDGKVTAVLGTHTHVQTADNRILAKGTAFISDVGMTGARDGVIGAKPQVIIDKQRNDSAFTLEVAEGPYMLNGVLLSVDHQGKVQSIERIHLEEAD